MLLIKIIFKKIIQRIKDLFYQWKEAILDTVAEIRLLTKITKDVLVEFFILLSVFLVYCIICLFFFIINLPFNIFNFVYRYFLAKLIFLFFRIIRSVKNFYFKKADYPDAYRLGWNYIIILLKIDYEIQKEQLHRIFFVNTIGQNLLWLYRKTLQRVLLLLLPIHFIFIIEDWEAVKSQFRRYFFYLRNWYFFSVIIVYFIILGGRMGTFPPQLFWDAPSEKRMNWLAKNPMYLIDFINFFEYSYDHGMLWYIPYVSGYSLWKDEVWGIIGYLRARTLFDWFAEYIPYMTQMYLTIPRKIKIKDPVEPPEPDWYHDEFWPASDMAMGRNWRFYWVTRGQQETYDLFVNFLGNKLNLSIQDKEYLYMFIEWYDGFIWYMYKLPLDIVVPFFLPYLNNFDVLAFCYLDVYRPLRYYIGLFFFFWYLSIDFVVSFVPSISIIFVKFLVYICIFYLGFSWFYAISLVIQSIVWALLRNIGLFIIGFGVLVWYGRQVWCNTYVPLMKFRLTQKKLMLQFYWNLFYHPNLLVLKYYPDTIFNNRFIDFAEYKMFQLTMDKFLYKTLVEDDDEDDEEYWLIEERWMKNVILATTGGYSNIVFYCAFIIIISYPFVSTIMAKIFGWWFYFDRFAETEFERARESITFNTVGEFWAEDELFVIPKISLEYFWYKYNFKYILWYFNYLRVEYFHNKNYEIYTDIIELVDELVWECGMPCIIVFFVLLILYHFTEEIGAYFYMEDLFDFMIAYFCLLADESVDLSVFFNNISTIMLDTQCNVDYIGFHGLKPHKEYRTSTYWFRVLYTKIWGNRYYGKRRLKRFIAYWEPLTWRSRHTLPMAGQLSEWDRKQLKIRKYEWEKRRNRPNDPLWEANNFEYLQNLRTLNMQKNKDKNKKN